MKLFKAIDNWMLRRFTRYRLRRICKAIGIRPYWWQKQFALGEFDYIPPRLMEERKCGKTTAIMLRILMIHKNNIDAWAEAGRILKVDPDWLPERLRWYSGEYRRLKGLCINAGIPVLQVEIYRMLRSWEGKQ